MCGIIAVHTTYVNEQIAYDVFEGLMALQHRGQDSVGIANEYCVMKRQGLVKNAFQNDDLSILSGQICMGHVRYATNGVADNIQPLYNTLPIRTTLCHNGNIINIKYIKSLLQSRFSILIDTNSDSELILLLFNAKMYELIRETKTTVNREIIHKISEYLHETLYGSFCLLITIQNYGLVVIRDSFGIRPLIWGKNENKHMIASESASLDLLNYEIVRDVLPGETIVFENAEITPYHFYWKNISLEPCLFEYIYFARPDSIIEGICVNQARIMIGKLLGKEMLRRWDCSQIDAIIPVPDTSVTFATGIHDIIDRPIREGFIKNRYIDRTFIMRNSKIIQKNIKRKLSGIKNVFHDKNVLIVDDSIVRGNTSKHIIKLARTFGAKTVYFASCAPIVKQTNNYGIYIPTQEELVSFGCTEEEIKSKLEVDFLIYNSLPKITEALKQMNTNINGFETSMFK